MKKGLIEFFATHRVAANLLMALMLVSGLWAVTQMNVQLLPKYQLSIVRIRVVWPGANAEDVQRAITLPIEETVQALDGVKKMTSRSQLGVSTISLEFRATTNMAEAVEQIRQKIDLVRNFPRDAKPPLIQRIANYEEVARLLVGGGSLLELRELVHQYEKALLRAGITKITTMGLPAQEISIQIPMQKLIDLHLSLNQIADLIAKHSRDIPAGSIGKDSVSQELRSTNKQTSVRGFLDLPLLHEKDGHLIRLNDIATIEKRAIREQTQVRYQGKPAVQMILYRTENANALNSARILHQWLSKTKLTIPKGVVITPYFETWKHIKERIILLLKNGAWGLFFIVVLLFLFLTLRVALWVAIGIPASFLAAMAIIYLLGDSINMVSLFALIMTLGIIVDDSIVIGEEVLARVQQGSNVGNAIVRGTSIMHAPIIASSITTMVAFLPLMFISGVIGQILFAIPLVAICVICASLLECFLVLPGHLYHNLCATNFKPPLLQPHFDIFKEKIFRPFIQRAIKHAWSSVCVTVMIALITLLLWAGYMPFHFFPSPQGTNIQANVQFAAGFPPNQSNTFVTELEKSLNQTASSLSKREGKKLLVAYSVLRNQSALTQGRKVKTGEQYASVYIELISPDKRHVTNQIFIDAWRKNIKKQPGIESLSIRSMQTGPPGRDIDIHIAGDNLTHLKQASAHLIAILSNIHGVTNIADSLPYGKKHIIFYLNPQAHALNLTTAAVGEQLRAAFTGKIVQIYHEPQEEIEVRVSLPDTERNQLSTLKNLPIITPQKTSVALSSIVTLTEQRSFDVLTRVNNQLTNTVTADINDRANNMNRILNSLSQKILPELKQKYNVNFSFGGRKASQSETLQDMLYGILLALVLIYIILAWVFASYIWPLLVMVTIPLGLIGAIWGHVILFMPLTVLSLFGFFGLSGIVVNDSIILIARYKKIRANAKTTFEAIVEAACQRLRPVLLTSLTTIVGLLPLLFERSLQAQFLIPMAVSIVFGLLFSTLLILILLPSMLFIYENKFKRRA